MGWIGIAVKLVAPKRLPGFRFFLIAMGANNSFYVKSIATYAPTFFGYIISVLAMVPWIVCSGPYPCIINNFQIIFFSWEDEVFSVHPILIRAN